MIKKQNPKSCSLLLLRLSANCSILNEELIICVVKYTSVQNFLKYRFFLVQYSHILSFKKIRKVFWHFLRATLWKHNNPLLHEIILILQEWWKWSEVAFNEEALNKNAYLNPLKVLINFQLFHLIKDVVDDIVLNMESIKKTLLTLGKQTNLV